MFKHKYDHEFDDELPAIDVSSSAQNSSLEMPSAVELAARRARERSVERALRAAPDDSLLTALTELQVASPPTSLSVPSLTMTLLKQISAPDDVTKLHQRVIDVMSQDCALVRSQIVYEICTCLCSNNLTQSQSVWATLTIWSLAIGEGGICTKRAMQEMLQRYTDIDLDLLCEIMCKLIIDSTPDVMMWNKVLCSVRCCELYDRVLRRAMGWAIHSTEITKPTGPITESELLSAIECSPINGSDSDVLAALTFSGRVLVRCSEGGKTDSDNSVRERLITTLETQTSEKHNNSNKHECAISARRLRLLFQ